MRAWLLAATLLAASGAQATPVWNRALSIKLARLASLADFRGVLTVQRGPDEFADASSSRNLREADYFREQARGLDENVNSAANPFLWRWASVTKQVIAILVMQEVEAGRIDLDAPLGRYLPGFRSPNATTATIRQLLQHRAGLPNPDDTTTASDRFAAFYRSDYNGNRDPLTGYCAGPVKGPPGGQWQYNNCDYMVAGALLEAVTGKPWRKLVEERIAAPLRLRTLGAFPTRAAIVPGYGPDDTREPPVDLASFGAAAALYGSPDDLLKFDRALLEDKLIRRTTRDELWRGDPALGYQAIGQWSFTAPLSGCAKPVRIVERRGEIGGVGVRNFILPELDTSVVIFTNRAAFDFGEVWQGKGFSFDVLSAVACPSV